jgi:hypothetical protein
MRTATVFLSLCLLSAPALAEGSTLTVSTTDNMDGTQTVEIDVTGSIPDALVLLAVGQTAGETTFTFGPLGTLTLGLAQPFALPAIGFADGDGNVSLDATAPTAVDVDLLAQAVGFQLVMNIPPAPGEIPVQLEFCTSNVAMVSL